MQGFYEVLQQAVDGVFVAGIQTALQEEFQNFQVVTEADVLTVSDGRGFVTAHAGGMYYLIAGELELLATMLHELRDVGKCFFFHTVFIKNSRQR